MVSLSFAMVPAMGTGSVTSQPQFPKHTGRPLVPQEGASVTRWIWHIPNTAAAVSGHSGARFSIRAATTIQLQHSSPSFQWCFGTRVCSRSRGEAGSRNQSHLCIRYYTHLVSSWVQSGSFSAAMQKAMQSQVLVSDFGGCFWRSFQCWEGDLKLLKSSSL